MTTTTLKKRSQATLEDKLRASTSPIRFERIPEGHPNAGRINNCALSNSERELDCRVCKGACPDRAEFRSPQPGLRSQDPLTPWQRKREAEAEVEAMIERVNMSPDFERLLETSFKVPDAAAERDELVKALQVGEGRNDVGTLKQALDRAQHNAMRAFDLYCAACVERTRYELDADVVEAAMWTEASEVLEEEKAQGDRRKAITDADVRTKMAAIHPEQWRAAQLKRTQVKRLVDSCERLADLWRDRAKSLESLLGKGRA